MSTNVEPLTRVYMVPLRRAFEAPKYRRTKVAIRVIREFTSRHMKATEVKIEVGREREALVARHRKPAEEDKAGDGAGRRRSRHRPPRA